MMRLLPTQTQALFGGFEHHRLTKLIQLEIVLNECTSGTRFLKLLAVCDLYSRDRDCAVRQLYQFDPTTGLMPLDELKHPFTPHGTPSRRKRDYRRARKYIEKELKEGMRLHWDAAVLAKELTAPESDEEKPPPRHQ